MKVQRSRDAGGRGVWALQMGAAVGLLVLAVLAEHSTAPSLQVPVLLLVLAGALLIERRQRGPLPRAAGPAAAATPPGAGLRPGCARLWGWLQRQISDGVVHGHEEGERCNALCRRTRPLDERTSALTPTLAPILVPGSARACVPGRPGQRGAARLRSPRSTGTRISS